jgi:hypothetical protein
LPQSSSPLLPPPVLPPALPLLPSPALSPLPSLLPQLPLLWVPRPAPPPLLLRPAPPLLLLRWLLQPCPDAADVLVTLGADVCARAPLP